MSFNGPAPELVNGRLAMLGFFAAVSAEIMSHETVLQQFADAPGAVLSVSGLFILASIIPIIRGSAVLDDGAGEGLKFGSFNVTNEVRARLLPACHMCLRSWCIHKSLAKPLQTCDLCQTGMLSDVCTCALPPCIFSGQIMLMWSYTIIACRAMCPSAHGT